MGRAKSPPILDVTAEQLQQMLEVAKERMPPEMFAIIEASVATNASLTAELKKKGTTIRRLRKLMGIKTSEKTRDVLPKGDPSEHEQPASDADEQARATRADGGEHQTAKNPQKKPKNATKGHGRLGAPDYPGAKLIHVPHERIEAGDPCPDCGGKLYPFRDAPTLHIRGGAPLKADLYRHQQWRCSTCLRVFTARGPDEAQGPKYDESATAVIGIFHYHAGTPFNRLANLQQQFGIPVPASTQWDLVNKGADVLWPMYFELLEQGANGTVMHIDDSYVRILELMGKRRDLLVAASELENPERTGLFTTAVVSVLDIGPVALFFNGRQHAGENLADVLEERDETLQPPIVMSDALNRNVPKGHAIVEANCMSHARRGVVDEVVNYPDLCWVVLGSLAQVYRLDAELKKQGVSVDERLHAHQQHSGPILDELYDWMQGAIDNKVIEPNSGMGQALGYFIKYWPKLTLFLRKAGAPIDNNFAERVLKLAIRYRRNSLFYRNQRGALVSDIYMTIIHTAVLHGVNPLEYLTVLLRHGRDVAEAPDRWLPWNYKSSVLPSAA